MIRKSIIFFTLLILVSCMKVKSNLRIQIAKPENWIEMNEKETFKTLYRDSAESKLDTSRIDKKFGVLFSYRKYDTLTREAMINPIIQVQVQNNIHEDFDSFFASQSDEANYFTDYFKNGKFIDRPKSVEVDGVESVYFSMGQSSNI